MGWRATRKPNSTPPPKGVRVQAHHAVGNSAAEIMAKHVRGPNRLLPPGNPNAQEQMRFARMPSESYHDMLNKVSGIKQRFEALPSQLRLRFENDPGKLLAYLDDPKNRPEAVRLGLVPMTDAEYQQIQQEESQRHLEALGKALRSDPEAQPDYSRQAAPKLSEPPPKGGPGGK